MAGVFEAATHGSKRDLLVALRDTIAAEIDNGVAARDLAALSLRLVNTVSEIEAIDAATNGDDVGNAAALPDEEWPAP